MSENEKLKAHTPTDDEREALARIVADGNEPWTIDYQAADAILAAGFRRSEVPEWEYGWDSRSGFEPTSTPTREYAEEVIGRNPDWLMVKRIPALPAGPWEPLEN